MENVKRFLSSGAYGREIVDIARYVYGSPDVIDDMTNEQIFQLWIDYNKKYDIPEARTLMSLVNIIFDVDLK